MKPVIVYTDGACSGNPGPGGWAAVVLTPKDDSYFVQELGGGDRSTTNNRMEMTGVLEALKFLLEQGADESQDGIVVYTDSTYVIRGITQWIWGWMRNNFKNSEGQDVANQDIWRELSQIVSQAKKLFGKIDFKYVRGHQGFAGNERCDEIAVAYSKSSSSIPITLHARQYEEYLSQTGFDLLKTPPESALPEMKNFGEKKKEKAQSYLSMIGGSVVRHKSWSSCEARVKGKSGAKFKKAMSDDDEKKILADWCYHGVVKDE